MQKYLSLFVHSTPMGLMTQSDHELHGTRSVGCGPAARVLQR